jgi:hypothetical protein
MIGLMVTMLVLAGETVAVIVEMVEMVVVEEIS